MRDGQAPIHIMRWAPADFVNDPFVRLLVAEQNFTTLSFYFLALNWSHIEGGNLPSDPKKLGAILGFRPKKVENSLRFCVDSGKLRVENGQVFHRRVVRDIEHELSYRSEQAELGRKGGQVAGRGRPKNQIGVPLSEIRGHLSSAIGPPAPSPAPAPAPTAAAAAANRGALISALETLAQKSGEDPEQLLRRFSKTERGASIDGYVGLDRASDAWIRRTHTLILNATSDWDAGQDGTSEVGEFFERDQRTPGQLAEAVLEHRVQHPEMDAEAALAQWCEENNVPVGVRILLRRDIARAEKKRQGKPPPQ